METQIFPYLATAASGLLGCLVAVVAWVGVQIRVEMRELAGKVEKIGETLAVIERDLRGELSSIDRRVSIIEARCKYEHNNE